MIPKLIHRIWLGPPMPPEHEAFGRRWEELYPDWEMWLWGEAALAGLGMQNQDLYDRAEELAPGFEGQLRSDVARYEILYRYGGLYVDTDFEPLRSFEDRLPGLSCFFAWEHQDEVANNAIMGADPGTRSCSGSSRTSPSPSSPGRGNDPPRPPARATSPGSSGRPRRA